MKTNQNMIRKMGDFEVVQRTKDGMFNATGLLKQWNNIPINPKRSFHEAAKDLILPYDENGPTDMSTNPEKYMEGFGE